MITRTKILWILCFRKVHFPLPLTVDVYRLSGCASIQENERAHCTHVIGRTKENSTLPYYKTWNQNNAHVRAYLFAHLIYIMFHSFLVFSISISTFASNNGKRVQSEEEKYRKAFVQFHPLLKGWIPLKMQFRSQLSLTFFVHRF